ncbi:hypothetical protein AB6A40_005331 [Gnathostoma spinigerum]|uniref:CTLH domain-containing protein n=1 Tax=Gnathostoma spinigerum TaxID=75299 RepID=A0ABD6EPY8_9BILA
MSGDSDAMGASVSGDGICDFLSSDASTPSPSENRSAEESEDLSGWYQRYQNISSGEIPSADMKSLVVDYLISEGYREAAELLCADSGLPFPKDAVENLDARMMIRDAIISGNIPDAIQRINSLVPTLLDDNPLLHIQLLQQNLIELIRQHKVEESLKFSEEFLAEKCDEHPEMREKLAETFALLIYDKPETSQFGSLMDISHRQMVAAAVNGAVLKASNKPAAPRIEGLFRMIVWAQQQLSKREDDAADSIDILNKLFLDE